MKNIRCLPRIRPVLLAVEFPFQSELGNVFSGVTRDAFDVMFNDVFYVDDFTNVNPKDNIDFLVDVDYNINKVEYELSYASNKFDKALFGGTAKVNVANKEKRTFIRNRTIL